MTMRKTTRELKRVLRDYPHKTWCRTWNDGEIWVGIDSGLAKHRTPELAEFLNERGYRAEMNGKPGTSGEFIIDVTIPSSAIGGRVA